MRAEALLAMAGLRAEAAEVFFEESDRTVVEFRAGRFRSQETRLSRGRGLRVVSGGRLGFASSSDEDRGDELVDAALGAAGLGPAAGFGLAEDDQRFAFAGPAALPAVAACNSRVMLHPAERMVGWGEDICAAMRSRVPDLELDLVFSRTWHETRVLTTAGGDVRFERATFDLRFSGRISGQADSRLAEYLNLSEGEHPDLEPLCDRLEQAVRASRRKARLRTADRPVIVMPLALPVLLAPLASGVSGRQLERESSPLVGREGERVIAECLTIADNPLRPYGLASAPADGEGVPTRRNLLFERGVFRGFLHDLASAAGCGRDSTGSARRDYANPPAPGISNLEILPGDGVLEEAMRGVEDGVLVCGLCGMGGANLPAGEVALGATSALKVEDGEAAGRVEGAMISGNVYEMLASVDMVGAEARDLGRWFLPWLRFPSLRLTVRD